MKSTGQGPPHYHAICTTCGWELIGPNALPVGSTHAEKHRHYVMVTCERDIRFDGTKLSA